MKTSRSFPAVPESIRAARQLVLQAIGDVPPGLRDAIAVMVGELAMNAVQHAGTGFEVSIDLTGGTLRVEVTDSGGGRPAPQPMPPPHSARGRGLPIVDRLADAWGGSLSPDGLGKGIWFETGMPPGDGQTQDSERGRKVIGFSGAAPQSRSSEASHPVPPGTATSTRHRRDPGDGPPRKTTPVQHPQLRSRVSPDQRSTRRGPACAGRAAQRQSPALTPGQRRRRRRA